MKTEACSEGACTSRSGKRRRGVQLERMEQLYIYAGGSKGTYTSTTDLAGGLASFGPVDLVGAGLEHGRNLTIDGT